MAKQQPPESPVQLVTTTEPAAAAPDGAAPDPKTTIDPFSLPLGPPFAISTDCDLVDRDDDAQLPGCYATVKCNCGAMWRANLLSEDDKECPSCHVFYTHVFMFCPADDRGALKAIVTEVLMAHGIIPDDAEIEGDGAEEEGDDDEDDDTQDDDEDGDDTNADD